MMPLPRIQLDDAGARETIRTSLDVSVLVEASAGTGKTHELIQRLVHVLESGVKIESIVAVTFTHKAAGELKLRLRQELDRARAAATDAVLRANLEDALQRMEEAAIGTIHSFCAQILRERPVEALVDPAFEELSDQGAARLYSAAFRSWMERALDKASPGLRRALARLNWRDAWETGSPMDQLKAAGRKLIEWRDFPTPWRREPFEREQIIDGLVTLVNHLSSASEGCRRKNDNLYASLRQVRDLAAWIKRTGALARDYDSLESLLIKLSRDVKRDFRKGAGFYGDGISREELLRLTEELQSFLGAFQQATEADLAAQLRQEMWELVEEYDELKRRSGKLDFVDLLIRTRDLLRDDEGVRWYLQRRFRRVFVDEFQDTDPLQAEILLLLAAGDRAQNNWLEVVPEAGKLFVVGDPKQSIYKFRRADVVLYRQLRDMLVSRGARLVRLTRSFRATSPLQQCVNAAFEPAMAEDATTGQPGYSPIEGGVAPLDGQPAIVALPAPKPYGKQRIAKAEINVCLPGAIVAYVAWLLNESKWKVRDPEQPGSLLDIQARHVCLLFRRFTNFGVDLTGEYAKLLEARGIPHMLVGSKCFHGREEVETIRAALAAIEWPDDELSLFATIRGPLFAVPDDLLLRFQHKVGRLHSFRVLAPEAASEFAPIAEALSLMAELHRGRNRRPIADTINTLLEAARAHAAFAFRPGGEQALANVYRLCDLARSFEAGGGISFRAFVEELEAHAAMSEASEAPILEEDSEGVRIMTVHKAKGLEFPVVILADMTAKLASAEPDRYLDSSRRLCAMRLLRCAPFELLEHEQEEHVRERAEGVRVAYVAATRARDLLVVPVVGDEELDGWVSPLNRAVYPSKDRWRDAELAVGCPPFGVASVVSRPLDYDRQAEFSVRPGLHRPQSRDHSVVWWDPHLLRNDTVENFGVRQAGILGDSPAHATAGLEAYRRWQSERRQAIESGSAPRFDPLRATDAPQLPPGAASPIIVERIAADPSRPSGRRFGALVHAILEEVDFGADRDAIDSLARIHQRVTGATSEETEAAIGAVAAVLEHPIIKRARGAERCHRELPIVLRAEGNRLVEGVIDLAFIDRGAWTVVDFKTTFDLAAARKDYEKQIHWYTHALTQITGTPASGVLLAI